jgi:hypothetical protein
MIHFGQAQGTPFTIQPLAKIGWQANSPTSKELLQGFYTARPSIRQPKR